MTLALETEFDAAVRAAAKESRAMGFPSAPMESLLNKSAGATVAKRLVVSGKIHEGLKRIVAVGREDLAVEALMLQPKFSPLFTQAELSAAKWRLDQVKQ